MIPQTQDEECKEYIENEIIAPSKVNCELKPMTDRIIKEAVNLQKIFDEENYVCEICLKRLEIIIGTIKQCINDKTPIS